MTPHALTISKLDMSWYDLPTEERIRRLDAIEKAHKGSPKGEWSVLANDCQWPEWVIGLVKSTCARMQWDSENGEFKAGFPSEALAESAGKSFIATLTGYVGSPSHVEEKKWFDQQKFAVRVRPMTSEYMELDQELVDSLEDAEMESAGFLRRLWRKLWRALFGKKHQGTSNAEQQDPRVADPID
jgi:hypothetical protein